MACPAPNLLTRSPLPLAFCLHEEETGDLHANGSATHRGRLERTGGAYDVQRWQSEPNKTSRDFGEADGSLSSGGRRREGREQRWRQEEQGGGGKEISAG